MAKKVMANQTVINRNTNTIQYQGDIDLSGTYDRILKGNVGNTTGQYANDGIVYRNQNNLLPVQPAGYYHEYFVPLPNNHPGPASRLVIGQGGEIYFTPDHYTTTFIRTN